MKAAQAQDEIRPALTKFATNIDNPDLPPRLPADAKSMLLLIGAQIRATELDCSHFVQHLYEQAGLYYDYAPSRTLYDGVDEFRRVTHPQAGDLVVWRGHVGIVVDPSETTFLSALRSGVKTSSYESHYWKQRGKARFFRYHGSGENAREWIARGTTPRNGSNGY